MDGCTLRISLFVTFSDMYMVKMENDIVMSSKMEKDVVKPSKPIFYHRFADDIYGRRKLGDNFLFDWLNSYDPNIEFAIQVNTSKLLDTKITNIKLVPVNLTFIQKAQNYLHHDPKSYSGHKLKRYKRNTVNGNLHCSCRTSSNFDEEIRLIKEKFMKADYPLRFINSVVNEFQ